MRFPILVIAAACAAAPSAPVFAAGPAVAVAPDHGFRRQAALPKWALPLGQMPATVRTDPVVIRLSETQAWVGAAPATLYNRAIQVNDSSELGTIGQFGLDYYSAYQKLVLHRVAILRDGRTIDHTATVNARPLQRETAMESGMVGGATTLQLLLDDVRIGDTLWITYTIEGENPVFGKVWSGDFGWDSGSPTELRLLTVMHPVARPLQWRQLGDFRTDKINPTVDRVGEVERLRFEGRAIEAIEGEPSIPSDFLPGRVLQFSEYRDWQEVANWADGLFPKNKPSPALTALVRQFAGEPDPATRAAAALRWVQHEIRYFSVSIGENSHRPQLPDVVLKRRYGDCKDKSYLLVSLLSEMGIEARPVLLSASAPKVPARVLASPLWFNHVVVQITIDGHAYYVDPTSARQPEPLALIPGALPGAAALPVDRAATALVTLPLRTDTLPHHELVQQIAVADFDGAATMESRNIFRGSYADHARLRYPVMSVSEQKKAMLAGYEKRYPGITLEGAPVLQDFPAENRYEVRTRYRMPKAVTLKDKVYALDYDPRLIDDTLGIPDKIVRNFPLELAAGKYRGRYRLNITWPKQVRAEELPHTRTVDNAWFRAHEEYTFRGNVVDYLMDYRIKTSAVAAADMPAFQAEAKRLDAYGGGRFNVVQHNVSPPDLMRYSPREFDSLRYGATLIEGMPALAGMKDADIDSETACSFVTMTAGIEDIVGADVLRQARRLEKAVTAKRDQAPARECLALLAFTRGQFADGAALYKAEAGALKDDSRAVRNLAWASLYAGDADAAVAAMARYRKARAVSEDGAASNTEIADQIALLQRAGQPLPAEAQRIAAEIPDGPWPRPLLAMQAGLITPAALVKAAEALPGDARDFALTEAWFYIGQAHLARKEEAAARSAFQWISTGGIRSSALYPQALGELRRLAPAASDFKAGVSAYQAKDRAAALDKWQQGAAAGEANAQFAVGYSHYVGEGVPRDLAKALPLFEAAAAQGHARAQYFLGLMYDEGLGVAKDQARGVALFLAAGEAGDADAQRAAGISYRDGKGIAKDLQKSVFWLMRAVQRNDLGAIDALGLAYEFGWGVPKNLERGAGLYRIAAEAGNARAQVHLGRMYKDGSGVKKDLDSAVDWFRKSAAQGDWDGHLALGEALMAGQGVRQDYSEGLVHLRKAAEQGSDSAMMSLGFAYESGQGVVRDYAEAHRWYLQSAESGNSTSEFNLAVYYEQGKGGKRDMDEALKWYRQSATHGDVDAARILGGWYLKGETVKLDLGEAAKWYKIASDKGDKEAQMALARLYAEGKGVAPDGAKAYALMRPLAEQGDAIAMATLGTYYEKGTGVAIDYQLAAKWFRDAGAAGVLTARARLYQLVEDGRLPGRDAGEHRKPFEDAALKGDIFPWLVLADHYSKQGKYSQAQGVLERALQARDARPGNDDDLRRILDALATSFEQQEKYAAAEPVYLRLLALAEKKHGPNQEAVAGVLWDLARIRKEQGQLVQAEQMYLRALRIREKVFGPRDLIIAKTMRSLARLYSLMQKRVEARAMFEKALAMLAPLHGAAEPEDETALEIMTEVHYIDGDLGLAVPVYKRLLALHQAKYGADSTQAVRDMQDLGGVYQDLGQYELAESLFANAVAITEQRRPADSDELANALFNLGQLYSDGMGKFEQAQALLERTLAMYEQAGRPESGDVGTTLRELGNAYNGQKKYVQAEASFIRVLKIQENRHGPDRDAVLLEYFGVMLTDVGRYAEAEAMLQRALVINERAYAPGHLRIARTLRQLARLYRKTNRAGEAVAFEKRAGGTS